MATKYVEWLRATEETIRADCQEAQALLESVRRLKAGWPGPAELGADEMPLDREAARADAVHRAWQAVIAAELDAAALCRSLRAILSRLDRGERPFTMDDDSVHSEVPVGPV